MKNLETKITDALNEIKKQTQLLPKIGIILGTGMGGLVKKLKEKTSLPYSQIPGFPYTSEKSEQEQLIIGQLSGKPILIMPKRFHYYEGFTSAQISFPIRLLSRLGIQMMIICNCAGGLNPLFQPGDLMAIVDHINLLGTSPLIGPNQDTFGPRFPDMKNAYDPELIIQAENIALEEKIRLHKGVYIAVHGPNLETPAETRFLRSIGGDAIGMSTVPEVIVGVHAGLCILGFSIISNVNLPDAFKVIDYDEIVAVASEAESKLINLIVKLVEGL